MALQRLSAEKRAATDKEMLKLLRKWISIEDQTIRSCAAIVNKAKNPIIGTLSNAIKNDSEKHKAILQLVIDGMTKSGFVLSPDDLAGVSSLLNKHIALEVKSIETASKALELCHDPIITQMLKLILEDEKKHKKMASQMNDLKFYITAKIS
jgi:bacterioferritin (cytochrome b1)